MVALLMLSILHPDLASCCYLLRERQKILVARCTRLDALQRGYLFLFRHARVPPFPACDLGRPGIDSTPGPISSSVGLRGPDFGGRFAAAPYLRVPAYAPARSSTAC